MKAEFEKKPIDWSSDKCYLGKFKLDIFPTSSITTAENMSYGDFITRYEHKFLRNIFEPKMLKNTENNFNFRRLLYCVQECYFLDFKASKPPAVH